MKIEKEKNFKNFSNKLHNKKFKERFKPIRGLKIMEDPREVIHSFNSGMIATDQALYGSVNPNERDQIITEISREGSKKVPSVSHSRPVTGRGINALNTNSTNKNKFDFTSRMNEGLEMEEMGLFQDKSFQHDFKISGGGSSYNGGLMNSIKYDPFNNSIEHCTPRENIFETNGKELEKGICTLENPMKKTFLYPKFGVKSEKNEENKKSFFADIIPIIERSESKFSKTNYPENSEKIVQELSAKLSGNSNSRNTFSKEPKKKGKKKRLLRIDKKIILEEGGLEGKKKYEIEGVKTSKPQVFNVPSILRKDKSVKKGKSVRFTKDVFFGKKYNDFTEKSFNMSGNTSNMIPSITRDKLKPIGEEGNHIKLPHLKKKFGPQSLQPNNINNNKFFDQDTENINNLNKSKRVEKLKTNFKLKRTNIEKSRDNQSMKIIEEKNSYTEKLKKKGKKEEEKNILKVVGKRVLKRVKECIRGIDNLKVNIVSDQKSKKITFAINDSNDQNFGLQFDFVMGNDSQEVNLNDFMISSNETTPLTPSKVNKIEEEVQTPKKKKQIVSKEEQKSMFGFSEMSKKQNHAKESNGEGKDHFSNLIGKYPHLLLQDTKKEVQQFEDYMKEKLNSADWGAFSKNVLQLLYGIGIKPVDFQKMSLSWQKMFKKLLVDRYFKDVKENIYERLAKHRDLKDLLPRPSERDNLDIWGISVDDYKTFFGDFKNYFKEGQRSNYPELGYFFDSVNKNVSTHLDSKSQIESAKFLVNNKKNDLELGEEEKEPISTSKGGVLGKRKFLFRCDDFSVCQNSIQSNPKKESFKKSLFNNGDLLDNGIFVENEDQDEGDMLKMTPSCRGNNSANLLKESKFTFQNTLLLLNSPHVENNKKIIKTPSQTNFSLKDLRTQLSKKVGGKLGSLVEVVTPNVVSKKNLIKTLKFFLSNLTNDLILHMIKINYLKKGKKIDEEGDGMVDLEVSDLIVQIVTNITKDAAMGLSQNEHLSTEFLQKFDYEIDYEIIQDFLAKREALNCLQRKKNNKYRRPKRNDEKVKKVYKKIMNQFLDDFKKKYFGMRDREDPNTYLIRVGDSLQPAQTDYSYAFKPKEMELCFYAHYFGHLCSPPIRFCPERVGMDGWSKDSEEHLKKWPQTGLSDKEISTRAKMLIQIGEVETSEHKEDHKLNASITKSFKEFKEFKERGFFKAKSTKTSKLSVKSKKASSMMKINSFFDPTKKNFDSRVFRSFTQEYFNHLLKADTFRQKVVYYLREKFVIDFMKDYPTEIAKKIERNRFHMLDLQKKKSKFLWNRYELLVALEYFKEKYCKKIFLSEFPRSIKRGSLGIDTESFENNEEYINHQSGLIKYFGNNEDNSHSEIVTKKDSRTSLLSSFNQNK